jgi:hypothetical protein
MNFFFQQINLGFCPVDFAQYILRPRTHRKEVGLFLLRSASQELLQEVNSMLPAHKKLNSAGIANEIRLSILVGAFLELRAAQETREKLATLAVFHFPLSVFLGYRHRRPGTLASWGLHRNLLARVVNSAVGFALYSFARAMPWRYPDDVERNLLRHSRVLPLTVPYGERLR